MVVAAAMIYREDGINDGAAADGDDSSHSNYSQLVEMVVVEALAMVVLMTCMVGLVAETVPMMGRV